MGIQVIYTYFALTYLLQKTYAFTEIKAGLLLDNSSLRFYSPHSDWFSTQEVASSIAFHIQNSGYNIATERREADTNNAYATIVEYCRLMESNMAIIGTHHQLSLNALYDFANHYRVPYITLGMTPEELPSHSMTEDNVTDTRFVMFMRPNYMKAVFDLIVYKHWKQFVYLFNSEEGLYRAQHLFDKIDTNMDQINKDIYHAKSLDDAEAFIERLARQGGSVNSAINIVLDMSYKDTDRLLRKQRPSQSNRRFDWILVTLATTSEDMERYEEEGVSVTSMSMINPANPAVKQTILDWRKQHFRSHITTEEGLAMDAVTLLYKTLQHFNDAELNDMRNGLEYLSCENSTENVYDYGETLVKAMKNIEFNGITGTVAFDGDGLRINYNLKISQTNIKSQKQVVSWSEQTGLKSQIIYKPTESRPSEKTYIVTSILTPPFLMPKPGLNTTESLNLTEPEDMYEGFALDLMRKLCDQVAITCKLHIVKDGQYGSSDRGSWTGMVGELIRHEADIAIAPLTITSSRESVVDFSKPYLYSGIALMMKKQDHILTVHTLSVFDVTVYICIAACFIVVLLGSSLLAFFNPKDKTKKHPFTIPDAMWFTTSAFLNQFNAKQPRSIGGRILATVSWFFTIVFICHYTGNLMRYYFAQNALRNEIRNVYDLPHQTRIKYGTLQGGSTSAFFKFSTIPLYEQMWEFMAGAQPSVFVSSLENAVHRVQTEGDSYAFLGETTSIQYISGHNCDVVQVGEPISSLAYGIATPIGSELKHTITVAMMEFQEVGFMDSLKHKWWSTGFCAPYRYQSYQYPVSLSLSTMYPLFAMLVVGMALSLLIALLEFCCKSCKDARERQVTLCCTMYFYLKLAFSNCCPCTKTVKVQ